MPVRTDFKPGQFCWIDLIALDLPAASAWYGELFGWTAVPQDTAGGPPYHFMLRGGAPAAAVGQMNDEMRAAGVPQCWNSYVRVDDCAASEARAAELGATITVPTTEIPGHGKLCFFSDPGGASVALWQQTGEDQGVFTEEHGGLSWNELICQDVAQARAFYGQLFGWTFEDSPMGDAVYTLIKADGAEAGGMMALDDCNMAGVPPHWAVYFAVDDCAATAARVTERGGSVFVPPTTVPIGTFSVLSDPAGGAFSIIELAESPCE